VSTTFDQLGLRPELLQAAIDLGFQEPTPIQAQTIPLLLEGRDVLGQAQTGTGKTAAFGLPMLQHVDPGLGAVQGLVLAPTRELANQVATALHDLGERRGARILPIYGGQPYGRQISRLRRGVDIVVGTPGRLVDLLRRGVLDLGEIRTVVLDEADEMLSMGFHDDIETILGATPPERQTALFSATLPDRVHRLAERYMRDPQAVAIGGEQLAVDSVQQRYHLVRRDDKLAAITRLLILDEVQTALVFARTRVGTDELATALGQRGFSAEALHGDLPQATRESILRRFRSGQTNVLVATDVAARGLHVDGITHVINYDLPDDPEYYVHRIGRTGRAGEKGIAISLVTPQEAWRIRRLERFGGQSISRSELPTISAIRQQREALFMRRLISESEQEEDLSAERKMLASLAKSGHDPLDLAAAAIRLARAQERQLPIEEIAPVQPHHERRRSTRQRPTRHTHGRPRRPREAGMVRLVLDIGREDGLRPAEVVGSIAGTCSIPGQAIGAIRMHRDWATVDVREQHASKVLAQMKGWRLRGRPVHLRPDEG